MHHKFIIKVSILCMERANWFHLLFNYLVIGAGQELVLTSTECFPLWQHLIYFDGQCIHSLIK